MEILSSAEKPQIEGFAEAATNFCYQHGVWACRGTADTENYMQDWNKYLGIPQATSKTNLANDLVKFHYKEHS